MRHSETATFSTAKIKAICKIQEVDFKIFEEICKKLEGKKGFYNRYQALIFDRALYVFTDDEGNEEKVPAELVIEDY